VPSAVADALGMLEPVFEQVRYPSGVVEDLIPADTIGHDDAQEVVEAAREVMAWVRVLHAGPPGRPRSRRS